MIMKKIKLSSEHRRVERYYYAIQLATICWIVISGFFLPIVWSIIAAVWFVLNAVSYHKGKYEICIDEYEYDGYPELGIEKMVKSWRWNIPVLLFLAYSLTHFSCETNVIIGILYSAFFIIYDTDK